MRHPLSCLVLSVLGVGLCSAVVHATDERMQQQSAPAPSTRNRMPALESRAAMQLATAGGVQQASLDPRLQQRWVSAIGNDRVDTLRQMLDSHQPQQLLSLTASNGKNALMVASKKGDLPLVKSLIAAGADIDERTQTNGTAFMFAVLGNRRQIAEWLLAKGADIQVIGSNGWTALTLAAAKGHTDMLQWLIDMGAETQIRDVYRYTPFMRAVENGQDSVAVLLANLPGTDVNAQDEYDNTPLHHAVSANDIAMVRLLMQHGADPDMANRDGATPVMLAADKPAIQDLLR